MAWRSDLLRARDDPCRGCCDGGKRKQHQGPTHTKPCNRGAHCQHGEGRKLSFSRNRTAFSPFQDRGSPSRMGKQPPFPCGIAAAKTEGGQQQERHCGQYRQERADNTEAQAGEPGGQKKWPPHFSGRLVAQHDPEPVQSCWARPAYDWRTIAPSDRTVRVLRRYPSRRLRLRGDPAPRRAQARRSPW